MLLVKTTKIFPDKLAKNKMLVKNNIFKKAFLEKTNGKTFQEI